MTTLRQESAKALLERFLKVSYGPQDLDDQTRTFRIGELASELGVSLRTLRFYEDRGMVTPERRGSTRIYSLADRRQLQLIVLCKKLGFSLFEITEILELYARGKSARQRETVLEILEDQVEILEAQREHIDTALKTLHRAIDCASEH